MNQFKFGEISLALLKPLKPPLWPEEEPTRMVVFVSRRADDSFEIFHTHCTHVGCPIEKLPVEGNPFFRKIFRWSEKKSAKTPTLQTETGIIEMDY